MFRHKIKSVILKRNTLKQQSHSRLVYAQPQWTLFERMEYADKLYNQPKSIDFVQQQIIHRQRCQHIIELTTENFTQSNLLDAIQSLQEQGGEIRLPAGRLELHNSLYLT